MVPLPPLGYVFWFLEKYNCLFEMVDKENNLEQDRLIIFPGLIAIAVALIVRFLFLNSDPPYFFSRTSQDILSDPYNYVHFSRNMILFGNWEIFDYSRWIVFKNSLVTIVSYLFFLAGGVSRISANLSAIFLSTAGLVLFAMAHLKRSKLWVIITAVMLLTNITLIAFGRYPFLETGLIFFCGLIYFLFNRYYPSRPLLILTGLLLALCGLSGKMFGMVLIVPVAFVLWSTNRRQFIIQFGTVLISTVISFIILAWLFFGSEIGSLFGFLGEHASGIYGFPEALSSPVKFIEHLISFGRKSRLFFFSPFMLILIALSLTAIILNWGKSSKQKTPDPELLFCIGWLAGGYLLLMLFNYRPLRYQLFLLMPTAGIVGYVISCYKELEADYRLSYKNMTLLFLIWWSFWSHLIFVVGLYFFDLTMSEIVVWYGLPIAIIMTVAFYLLATRLKSLFKSLPSYLLIILCLSVVFQGVWIQKWFDKRTYNLVEAGQSLACDIAGDAVLIGPYASALTIDNGIKSFIYWFGMAQKEPKLFADYPVTHITADISNWDMLFKDYPFLDKKIRWVSDYRIRDIETRVARMPDDYMARYNPGYNQTGYERGIRFFHLANADSCIYYLNQSLVLCPNSKSTYMLLANYYLSHGVLDVGYDIFDKLIQMYPRDFSICMEAGSYRYSMYHLSGNDKMLVEADKMFDRAISINPYCRLEVKQLKEQADSIYTNYK
ncbi:MAG: hypothetical protein DRP51_03995 [Candidatus Zixiibacteriota bacterium]|nr:MAG: hypothetical protein DRP51_03995 [candidate division Zixibacteria bacterium]